jgi:hydrogenase maturation factor HypE
MTVEEAKELEIKIANDILNNAQLSAIIQLVSEEAKTRAKKVVSDATPEQLIEMKNKFEELEKEMAEAEAGTIKEF